LTQVKTDSRIFYLGYRLGSVWNSLLNIFSSLSEDASLSWSEFSIGFSIADSLLF